MEDTANVKMSEEPKTNDKGQDNNRSQNEEQRPPYPPYYQYPYYYPYYYQYPPSQGSPSEKDSRNTAFCPTCAKPGYSYPYNNKESLTKRKFLKVPISFWIMGLFFLIIFSCAFIAIFSGPGNYDSRDTFDAEVIIAQGGHFKYSLGYSLNDEYILDISSRDGTNFDVYIMDEDQYENAYDTIDSSIISFSSFYSNENTNGVEDELDFTDERSVYKEYFLVIDNRDTRITPNDAQPVGTLTIDVNIIINYFNYYM